MQISVWLTNETVQCFNFNKNHKIKLENKINNLNITLHNNSTSFKESLKNADIVFVWVFKDEWFKNAKKLKWIVTPAAGKDYFKINLPENIKITYGSFHGKIMAETLIGMILSASRGILKTYEFQNKIEWPRKELEKSMTNLSGSHVVILGFGSIGNHIARLIKPFGVRITGIKRKIIESPSFFDKNDRIISIENFNTILPETDHLVVVLPRDESTENIINKKRLDLLPEHAYIYNIGRGNSINEDDLMEALNNKKIAGAYLDVFKEEPIKLDSPLRNCPNIFIMPHASAIAPNYMDLFVDEFIINYNEWIKNQS